MYLTYDLRKTPGYGWIGLYIQIESSSGKYYVERGHIEDGEFVADATYEQARNTYFRQELDSTYGDVQLWRITGVGHILRKGFCPSTASSSTALYNQLQPCVECVGRLNYLNNLIGTTRSRTSISQSTMWMEHEAIKISGDKDITSLAGVWNGCYSLQSLEIGDWPVHNWSVTTLSSTWNDCFSLPKLEINNWDVSDWSITTLFHAFYNCASLVSLDLSNWDVSDWPLTTINGCWGRCFSLQELLIDTWDVSDWPINDIQYIFNYCTSLKDIPIAKWDVSNWEITTMRASFSYMQSLEVLDLSSWDISNWQLTTIENCFLGTDFLTISKLPDGAFGNITPLSIPLSVSLQDYNGQVIYEDHSYDTCYMLTPSSIINIFNKLPTISASKTITLGAVNQLKVTSADIAIATQKGWTVA
jgi:surface protein